MGLDTNVALSQYAALGNCSVVLSLEGPLNGEIHVLLLTSGPRYEAGGTWYHDHGPTYASHAGNPMISATALQSCGLTSVTNLAQNGADYVDAVQDDYMGFSFRATDPADGKTYDYEYALKGVTNTQLVATKTLYIATPTTSPDEALIAGLQSARMKQLIANQPDLSHFHDGKDGPQVSMSALDGNGNIDARFIAGPFWGQVTASWADAGAAESQYVLGSVGAHRKIGDNAAIGFMAQFDHIKHDDPLGRAKGDDWLIGPYVVAKVPEKRRSSLTPAPSKALALSSTGSAPRSQAFRAPSTRRRQV
jgi:hypothetical protein